MSSQLTYSNVAIVIESRKDFERLQDILQISGFVWKGRENNDKYIESYDSLLHIFNEKFILFFPNENTIDVTTWKDESRVRRSGRRLIHLTMDLSNFPSSLNQSKNRQLIFSRFTIEYEESRKIVKDKYFEQPKTPRFFTGIDPAMMDDFEYPIMSSSPRMGKTFMTNEIIEQLSGRNNNGSWLDKNVTKYEERPLLISDNEFKIIHSVNKTSDVIEIEDISTMLLIP